MEKRSIIRYDIGFYSNIVVGAIYAVPKSFGEASQLEQWMTYAPALTACIHAHPFLAATIQNSESNRPIYTSAPNIDLRQHIAIIVSRSEPGPQHDETLFLQTTLEDLHNNPRYIFSEVNLRPAWAIYVLPLAATTVAHRVFVAFVYSHSHGDGVSGLSFHHTFHRAFSPGDVSTSSIDWICAPSSRPLLEPVDTPSNIKIDWSYLIRPVLGAYAPAFMTSFLGITTNISGADARTWTGALASVDEESPGMRVTSNVKCFKLSTLVTTCVLKACRQNKCKVTALLNLLIAQCLATTLKEFGVHAAHFTSQVPVNLRQACGAAHESIGLYAGGAYLEYEVAKIHSYDQDLDWDRVRADGVKLANAAASLHNQPVGLLRYVSNFRSWFWGQIGRRRDTSWELSNLGRFTPGSCGMGPDDEAVNVEQTLFSQSAAPNGHPLQFNVTSIDSGSLFISLTWQTGALSLPNDSGDPVKSQEIAFTGRLASLLLEQLNRLGNG